MLLLGEGVEQREERHVRGELELEVWVAARALELGEHRRRRVARAAHFLGGDEVGEHLSWMGMWRCEIGRRGELRRSRAVRAHGLR